MDKYWMELSTIEIVIIEWEENFGLGNIKYLKCSYRYNIEQHVEKLVSANGAPITWCGFVCLTLKLFFRSSYFLLFKFKKKTGMSVCTIRAFFSIFLFKYFSFIFFLFSFADQIIFVVLSVWTILALSFGYEHDYFFCSSTGKAHMSSQKKIQSKQ